MDRALRSSGFLGRTPSKCTKELYVKKLITCRRQYAIAEQTLREHGRMFRKQMAKVNGNVKCELERIVSSGKREMSKTDTRSNDETVLQDFLNNSSLDELSAYVGSEAAALTTVKHGLETKRSAGAHRMAASTEKFIMEFDRFVGAYSGVVSIVSLADAQYGGVASATLSLLFAVRNTKHAVTQPDA
jgi:hypothetical protein